MMVQVVRSESNQCGNNASGNCVKSHQPMIFNPLQHLHREYTLFRAKTKNAGKGARTKKSRANVSPQEDEGGVGRQEGDYHNEGSPQHKVLCTMHRGGYTPFRWGKRGGWTPWRGRVSWKCSGNRKLSCTTSTDRITGSLLHNQHHSDLSLLREII